MSAFDDLIPAAQAEGNSFSDLVPQQQETPWYKNPDWYVNRVRGFAMRAADPTVGAVQMLANLAPDSEIARSVNQAIADKERQYQSERKAVGSEGFDWAGLAGGLTSPANLLLARAMPFSQGETVKSLAAKGGGIGGIGGALQPVTDTTGGFWNEKAKQAGIGALTGAVVTPAVGKAGEAIIRRIGAPNQEVAGAVASKEADDVIAKALSEVGQTADNIPQVQYDQLRQRVVEALQQGKKLDAAALLRKSDFEALGIKPTLGQITREAGQFARERNLRGVEGVGEPLLQRFASQDAALSGALGKYSQGAKGSFEAGEQMIGSLKQTDEAMRRIVSDAYKTARQSAGKDLEVPLQGLAQDFAKVADDFGDVIPAAVRNRFASYGLVDGRQTRLYTVEEADKLLKLLNDHVGSDRARNTALGALRDAVKKSVLDVDASGGVFAPAVKKAHERFKIQDAIPALKAAANGDISPDDFVRRYIIGGKVNDLRGLTKALDSESLNQAKAQVGEYLRKAAYGANAAGDKPFSQERFNKALGDIGQAKLLALFSPNEVFQLQRIGRVGAYVHSIPSSAAVNTSNTAGAIANLLQRIPGAPAAVSLANSARNSINNAGIVRRGIAADVPVTAADLTPAQLNMLRDLLGYGAITVGGLAPREVYAE